MKSKEIIINILSELSEIGEEGDLEEYYQRIFKKILKGMKRESYEHDCGWERGEVYINIEDFKNIFEI